MVLNEAGYDAVAMVDSMAALDILEHAGRIELLITCPEFAPDKPTGLSLVRMARSKRPNIKALFIGSSELAVYAHHLGTFIASPVSMAAVVEAARRLLDSPPPIAAN